MISLLTEYISKIKNNKLYKTNTLDELILKSKENKFGESGEESLTTYFICTAFENRFSPSTARIFRLCAMILSSPELHLYSKSNKLNISAPDVWYDENNNILTEQLDELVAIIQLSCFGFYQKLTVFKMLNKPDHLTNFVRTI